jgi:hypothetical protein
MTRVWPPIDYLDGWRSEIAEQPDGGLVVVVTAMETGRTWRAEKPTIEEALAVALRIVAEQTVITSIIDPEMA